MKMLVVACQLMLASSFAPNLELLSTNNRRITLLNSLKPAAVPLMDSGKAMARSGELLIDATSTPTIDSYGGGLSGAGANLRNAGDCVAQAAASCRFKTASELVCDEMREAATCLIEAVDLLKKGVDDANVDDNTELSKQIEALIPAMEGSGKNLEAAGAGIMKRLTVVDIGNSLYESGVYLEELALGIKNVSPGLKETSDSCGRLLYAAEKMREAGNNLKGVQKEKKKGKAWLKG